MKQTAVEWLIEQMPIRIINSHQSEIEKAKEMEKEQIIDAHIEGQRIFDKHKHTQWTTDQAELYFNETYGDKLGNNDVPKLGNNVKKAMTPKEKAEELINYFITLKPPKLSDYTQIYQPSAKLCAIKVCEEVLSYTDREKEFWEKVKQELEKL